MLTISTPFINPLFFQLFQGNFGLTDAEMNHLLSHFFRKFVDRKQHYLREGEICRYKAFINRGCTRSYITDELGKEHILFFAFEDWWIGDYESYHTQCPAKTNIQAIEDCELLLIPREDFSRLEQEIPKLEKWYAEKVQKMHFATVRRLTESKVATPQERYEKLLEKHPDILQRVPLQYIAAYLDIEPQSLSRMRKRHLERLKLNRS